MRAGRFPTGKHHGAILLAPLVLALALPLAGCGSSSEGSSAKVSVSGTVRGVGGPAGAPASVVSATITVSDDKGHEVAHTRLDEHGAYSLSLAPGSYRLSFSDATAPCPRTDLEISGSKSRIVNIECSRK
jgi:hypothetical protein